MKASVKSLYRPTCCQMLRKTGKYYIVLAGDNVKCHHTKQALDGINIQWLILVNNWWVN